MLRHFSSQEAVVYGDAAAWSEALEKFCHFLFRGVISQESADGDGDILSYVSQSDGVTQMKDPYGFLRPVSVGVIPGENAAIHIVLEEIQWILPCGIDDILRAEGDAGVGIVLEFSAGVWAIAGEKQVAPIKGAGRVVAPSFPVLYMSFLLAGEVGFAVGAIVLLTVVEGVRQSLMIRGAAEVLPVLVQLADLREVDRFLSSLESMHGIPCASSP